MPTYSYECESCKHTLDVSQSMKDDALKTCPNCKKNKLFRVISCGNIGIVMGDRASLGKTHERIRRTHRK